jgi:hypothetical protein
MQPEPPLDRDDIVSIMETLFDIRADVRRVLEILEADDEEEAEEDS